ncbi:PP2C family protein-serine/threonine phosphatase [Streptomyces sp. NBC_01198]|uniref:PP2C family protein-serine/threonine phosphatase n=1 Tax=Streptomyces sp. NBC_01198 TaxID=2903769 RepID=UPI002E144DEB|nr:serine/threonine-protein phosphatase [Streptomyces sp. NBC_01198]
MRLATARDSAARKFAVTRQRIARHVAPAFGARVAYQPNGDVPSMGRDGPLFVSIALITIILVLGLLLRPDQHLASLLVAPPTITAAACGIRDTAIVATASVGFALLLDAVDGSWGTAIPAIHVVSILFVTGFVIALRRIRERNIGELLEIRAVSDAVQRVLMRPLPERVGALRIASVYHSSQPWAQVGGDLYAAIRTKTGLRCVIGDVRGKGLPAVDDAVTLLGGFREAAPRAAGLPELAAYLEESIENHFQDIEQTDETAGERFVTALFLEISNDFETVKSVNCGHYPPLLVGGPKRKAENDVRNPPHHSPPLGLNSRNSSDYHIEQLHLGIGETLLLYTDGVTEARNPTGTFYNLIDRTSQWTHTTPQRLLQHILNDLHHHTNNQLNDDIAIIAITREPTPPNNTHTT